MKFPSRLRFLLLAPAFVLLSPPQSLRQAADGAGVSIGTAVRPSLFSEAAYASILAREFDVVEPEDAMKWWGIRRNPDSFDFREADEVVAFGSTPTAPAAASYGSTKPTSPSEPTTEFSRNSLQAGARSRHKLLALSFWPTQPNLVIPNAAPFFAAEQSQSPPRPSASQRLQQERTIHL
jgi:hypothetical protein